MNKLPHNYEMLAPTVMDMELIYEYLDELLELAKSGKYDRFEVCEALCELVQVRMGDNMLSPKLSYATQMFNLLSLYWPKTEEHLDSYLTVLINLDLKERLVEFLREKEKNDLKKYEQILINEIFDELQA